MQYGDILWVDDFDNTDSLNVEKNIKEYYSEQYGFRVDVQMFMLPLLKALEAEDEKNFPKYNCAVLDINLTRGFADIQNDFDDIKKILEKNHIRILDEHDPDQDAEYADFAENAGYYVYLYLVRRGFPDKRICMLTGNKGNTADEWENRFDNEKSLFKNAGFIAPEAFDRLTEREKFRKWLAEKLTPIYRLRACIIGMKFYAGKILADETLKIYLKNLPQIPLRLSADENIANREFRLTLKELVQLWESHKDENSAYQMTLKTTRNWFAHRCLEKISLLTTAFLFGIGMRGLLGKNLRDKIDFDTAAGNFEGYRRWENELLALIEELDERKPSAGEVKLDDLIKKSREEFSERIKNATGKDFKMDSKTDVCSFIQNFIGQKKYDIERREEDLLRDFLHGIYPNCNDREKRYLNAAKNTLTLAVNQ